MIWSSGGPSGMAGLLPWVRRARSRLATYGWPTHFATRHTGHTTGQATRAALAHHRGQWLREPWRDAWVRTSPSRVTTTAACPGSVATHSRASSPRTNAAVA
jgi:hypothetical protein